MDRTSLEQLLGQGLSLAAIARRVDLHEATVSYWVKKYGLTAVNQRKHAAKGGLTRAELERMVAARMSIAEIAERVGRSKATVRHWLGKYGLYTQGTRLREGVREARAAGLREATLHCSRHGDISHYLDNRGYYRCKRCRAEAVVRRRRKVKDILVGEAGGRCQLCGYDRYSGALEFHHLYPATKSFGLSMRGLAPSIRALRIEAEKCVLLCSNCHAEVEGGIVSVPA
jgi:transposase